MEILTGILCDQIRQEDNGKYILIGVYSGGVMVSAFPATFALAMMLQMRLLAGSNQPFKVRISIGGDVQGFIEGTVEQVGELSPANWIPINLPPLTFRNPGDLTAEVELPDGTWKQCFSIPVQAPQMPAPAS